MSNKKPRFIQRLSVAAVAAVLAATLPAAGFAGRDHHLPDRFYHQAQHHKAESFKRIATFPVFLNTASLGEPVIDNAAVAEIVATSADGTLLAYTDGENGRVGFVDISVPGDPQPAGLSPDLGGEPTSVAIAGPYALVGVNTSDDDFDNPSGELKVIDIGANTIVASFDLEGQPDSVAVSPNKRWAAIAIENERDEDEVVNGVEGGLPQPPAGNLKVLRLRGAPANWSLKTVDLTGLADKAPSDPEPEYVDINRMNVAVVTSQENNHIALVHLPSGRVIRDFGAGEVDLEQIDTEEEEPALISLTDSLEDVPREPDGVSWVNLLQFCTADEGDLDGGSRGITCFDWRGRIKYTSGNSLDHAVVRIGHYPDGRSGNKGNEPENIEYGKFGRDRYMFAASERSSVIFVYRLPRPFISDRHPPELVQILPSGVGPEGVLALPERNLLIAATEEEDRGDKFRAGLTIYELNSGEPTYPTIESADRPDGTPIPWAALSALAIAPGDDSRGYSVYDSFFQQSRIFGIDLSQKPYLIDAETILRDADDVLKNLGSIDYLEQDDDGVITNEVFQFSSLVNGDDTVNLDPEGLATRAAGGFWIASEGAGNLVGGVSDAEDRPFTSPNLLIKAANDGVIEAVVQLPASLVENQLRFGLEGVTAVQEAGNEVLYVAFQRAWGAAGDPSDKARIGRYDTATGAWSFVYYPLDTPESPNGGWVGLSEIAHVQGDTFAVVERDNQGGPDAAIKRIYTFSIDGVSFAAEPAAGVNEVSKELATDLIADGVLTAPNGAVIEKVEGLAVLSNGDAIINTDNDGVDDSSGETQMIRIEGLFED